MQDQLPDLTGMFGFYDSARSGSEVSQVFIGIDIASTILGLAGFGPEDFEAYLRTGDKSMPITCFMTRLPVKFLSRRPVQSFPKRPNLPTVLWLCSAITVRRAPSEMCFLRRVLLRDFGYTTGP